MKRMLFALFLAILGSQLVAEIQDGKVVAGAIRIRNYSLRPIQVNGYTIKGGQSLYLEPNTKIAVIANLRLYKLVTGDVNEHYAITSSDYLAALFNAENTFVLSLCDGTNVPLEIPMVDPNKPTVEFGHSFNAPIYFGNDLRNGTLEFDVEISTKWLFKQEVEIGERFKKAQAALK